MDLSKVYHDLDGNPCNIRQMVLRNLEWSCNRIQEGEKAIEALEKIVKWRTNQPDGMSMQCIAQTALNMPKTERADPN